MLNLKNWYHHQSPAPDTTGIWLTEDVNHLTVTIADYYEPTSIEDDIPKEGREREGPSVDCLTRKPADGSCRSLRLDAMPARLGRGRLGGCNK